MLLICSIKGRDLALSVTSSPGVSYEFWLSVFVSCDGVGKDMIFGVFA